MTKRAILGVALMVAGSGVVSGARQAAQAPTAVRTVLQRGDLSAPGHETVMARADFPPGAALGRHTHPGEEIGYVLEGSVILEMMGQAPRTLKAGDVFIIPSGTPHAARNSSAAPAGVLVTYVVEKGKPLSTPAP